MAVSNPTITNSMGDDATFRAVGSAIASAIAGLGLVQTGDTGQINWTTVTRPAVNTFAGYEIYRFADTLQATKPVYIKIEYGTASGSQAWLQLAVTVGTGTNGAGTLTGQVSSRRTLSLNSLPDGTSCYFSGGTNRLNFAMYANSTSARANTVAIERTKDSTGADNGDAIVLYTSANVGGQSLDVVPYSGTVYGSTTTLPCAVAQGESTGVNGTDTVVFPIYLAPRINRFPMGMLVGVISGDFTNLAQFSADADGGGAKNYIALSQIPSGSSTLPNSSGRIAMRYE